MRIFEGVLYFAGIIFCMYQYLASKGIISGVKFENEEKRKLASKVMLPLAILILIIFLVDFFDLTKVSP